jgi:hypothetical protein
MVESKFRKKMQMSTFLLSCVEVSVVGPDVLTRLTLRK